jgi:arsenate reductase (thioredoxin)
MTTDQSPTNTTAQRLANEFEGVFSPETVEQVLADSLDRLDSTATVHTYIHLFAERFARERLRAAAESKQLSISSEPEVLFVCVHNAGRSQMAAALLDHRSKGAVRVHSAGSAPAAEINPVVVEVMAEIGIDVSKEFPKPLIDEVVRAADVVVTMGCGYACPVFPGKRYLDWELPDPAGKSIDEVRGIRDLIDLRVQALLAELLTAQRSE